MSAEGMMKTVVATLLGQLFDAGMRAARDKEATANERLLRRDEAVRATLHELNVVPGMGAPIDMVLYCPSCHAQHIDAPEMPPMSYAIGITQSASRPLWNNPPHRSHLCAVCGFVWRPADVPTNGVLAIKTHGKQDTPSFHRDYDRPFTTAEMKAMAANVNLVPTKQPELHPGNWGAGVTQEEPTQIIGQIAGRQIEDDTRLHHFVRSTGRAAGIYCHVCGLTEAAHPYPADTVTALTLPVAAQMARSPSDEESTRLTAREERYLAGRLLGSQFHHKPDINLDDLSLREQVRAKLRAEALGMAAKLVDLLRELGK